MLAQLTIRNFGLIDDLILEFKGSLSILTGETGAGKSIIIDALRFALGERLNSAHIRNPEQPCSVEAVIELSPAIIREYNGFQEYVRAEEPTLIIHRMTTPDGRNKIKVNGFTLTVATLKELGNHLVDFHGPHDHQMLLTEESHMRILDRLSPARALRTTYEERFNLYTQLKHKLQVIEDSKASRDRDIDMVSHQVKELTEVPLEEEKYEECMHASQRLANTEKLYECTRNLITLFEQDGTGIIEQISTAFSLTKSLEHIDESTSRFHTMLTEMQDGADNLIAELHDYLDALTFEPAETQRITRMCDTYHDILRKYGPTIADARTFYEEGKEKLDLLVNLEQNDADLRTEIATAHNELTAVAAKITKERKKIGQQLEATIEHELKELGIKHVEFECRLEKVDLHADGADHVAFYISPNAGEPLKPLAEIVSSGEAARLMLALKKALIKVDPIPVLIFDEIDSSIGGRLGTITGEKLRELSSKRHVILITHLPQIASFAHEHYKVAKTVKQNHTNVTVDCLSKEARIQEMAKMMSGEKESSISLKHA